MMSPKRTHTAHGAGKGVYVLLIEAYGLVGIGALGERRFDGLYLYVGSAMGNGGLSRVVRHYHVSQTHNSTRRWHVDYLLAAGSWRGAYAKRAGSGAECALAGALARLAMAGLSGFGCSDCRCRTHLFQAVDAADAQLILEGLGLRPFFGGLPPAVAGSGHA